MAHAPRVPIGRGILRQSGDTGLTAGRPSDTVVAPMHAIYLFMRPA
jgi:hypothetical protein